MAFRLESFLFSIFLAAYLLSAMDRTADPCHDFFQYACGSWNRKHVIPEDRSSISTFEVMADQLQVVLKGLFPFPIGIGNDGSKNIPTNSIY